MGASVPSGTKDVAVSIVLLGLTTVAGLAFLQSPFSAGDSRAHVVKIWFVSELFKRGHWSYWCPVWYCGFPLLLYYPPLFYLVGGALNLPLGDPVKTLRILGLVAVYALVVGISLTCRQLGFTTPRGGFEHPAVPDVSVHTLGDQPRRYIPDDDEPGVRIAGPEPLRASDLARVRPPSPRWEPSRWPRSRFSPTLSAV